MEERYPSQYGHVRWGGTECRESGGGAHIGGWLGYLYFGYHVEIHVQAVTGGGHGGMLIIPFFFFFFQIKTTPKIKPLAPPHLQSNHIILNIYFNLKTNYYYYYYLISFF